MQNIFNTLIKLERLKTEKIKMEIALYKIGNQVKQCQQKLERSPDNNLKT